MFLESKSPALAGEVGEAVLVSRPPPPFRESVVEPTRAGDLTY